MFVSRTYIRPWFVYTNTRIIIYKKKLYRNSFVYTFINKGNLIPILRTKNIQHFQRNVQVNCIGHIFVISYW